PRRSSPVIGRNQRGMRSGLVTASQTSSIVVSKLRSATTARAAFPSCSHSRTSRRTAPRFSIRFCFMLYLYKVELLECKPRRCSPHGRTGLGERPAVAFEVLADVAPVAVLVDGLDDGGAVPFGPLEVGVEVVDVDEGDVGRWSGSGTVELRDHQRRL